MNILINGSAKTISNFNQKWVFGQFGNYNLDKNVVKNQKLK